MTTVTPGRRFEKTLQRLPTHIRDKVIFWVELVETLGLREVRKRKGFHDEPLYGKRAGERSVRLNRAYRLIYKEGVGASEIILLEVTKHEY